MSVDAIIHNIKELGLDPGNLSTVILTHCHIDHAGGAHEFKKRFGARIVIHNLDAAAVENGDKSVDRGILVRDRLRAPAC